MHMIKRHMNRTRRVPGAPAAGPSSYGPCICTARSRNVVHESIPNIIAPTIRAGSIPSQDKLEIAPGPPPAGAARAPTFCLSFPSPPGSPRAHANLNWFFGTSMLIAPCMQHEAMRSAMRRYERAAIFEGRGREKMWQPRENDLVLGLDEHLTDRGALLFLSFITL